MDQDIVAGGGASRVRWFAAGAFAVAAVFGVVLYFGGYFGASPGMVAKAEEPRTIIEGK